MAMKFRSIETAAYLALGVIIGLILHELFTSLLSKYVDDIPIPFEAFPEPPWRTPNTLDARVVTSTPFARFEIHRVKTESGAIVNDWLWTDERSHVNILVHLKDSDKYLLFRQKKYGLDREYLAVVGGLFNEGETAIECAKRELLEETGLVTDNWVSLGSYRVQVNRGGGILYAWLAKDAVLSSHLLGKSEFEQDYEKQNWVRLDREQLLDEVLRGEIGEAQWAATAAIGLLHVQHSEQVRSSSRA